MNDHPKELPLIVIGGPTGVGKTRLAIALAERLGGEIVGADSRQIYRYMDIGTAKPTAEERARIPHHLIDIRNPDEDYSAAEFTQDASAKIQAIAARGNMPLLVGGTGLYIHAVLYGIFEGPGRDDAFRAQMQTFAQTHGAAAVHEALQRVDPRTAQRLHVRDLVRVIRALEVHHLTGHSISDYQATATMPLANYQVCFLVLTAPRPLLYARLDDRVEQMLTHGLVDEVLALRARGYHAGQNAMNSVGYKEILEFLAGRYDRATALALIKRNTRRYAKRQLTWFRKYEDAQWISADAPDQFEDTLERCWQIVETWNQRRP